MLALDGIGEHALQQGEGLQGLAQVVARRRQEARLGNVGHLGLPFGRFESVRCAMSLGDVSEGDDDAADTVVLSAIG